MLVPDHFSLSTVDRKCSLDALPLTLQFQQNKYLLKSFTYKLYVIEYNNLQAISYSPFYETFENKNFNSLLSCTLFLQCCNYFTRYSLPNLFIIFFAIYNVTIVYRLYNIAYIIQIVCFQILAMFLNDFQMKCPPTHFIFSSVKTFFTVPNTKSVGCAYPRVPTIFIYKS